MRVLVTGASGFIGHAFCARALARGHDVTALVRRPGSEPPGTRAVAGDLGDGGALDRALAAARPRCVVHLAAEIASQRSEKKVRAVNVDGTARLIEARRGRSLGALLEREDQAGVRLAPAVCVGARGRRRRGRAAASCRVEAAQNGATGVSLST